MAWIPTYSGRQIDPSAPRASDIAIEDIAHALSQLCRWGGHTTLFYSVAQHSVLVSEAVSPASALWGLLHDAPEAYLGDLVRPVKYQPTMGAFTDLEERMAAAIAERFDLADVEPVDVAIADCRIAATEARDLLFDSALLPIEALPYATQIGPWLPGVAEEEFLARFRELTGAAPLRKALEVLRQVKAKPQANGTHQAVDAILSRAAAERWG